MLHGLKWHLFVCTVCIACFTYVFDSVSVVHYHKYNLMLNCENCEYVNCTIFLYLFVCRNQN